MIKNIKIILYGNILELSGIITFNDVVVLLNICIEKTSNLDVINVDLGKLESLNSSVLIFIINYIRSAIKNKQSIKFLNMPDLLIELSQVCNLNKVISYDEEN
ncbi:MAG TPA: STAS domain-containing protein [Candidatus Azoamicus sp. MARI]